MSFEDLNVLWNKNDIWQYVTGDFGYLMEETACIA